MHVHAGCYSDCRYNMGRRLWYALSLEAVIYCLLGVSQPLFEQADIRRIMATGGFARNNLGCRYLQMFLTSRYSLGNLLRILPGEQ
jgi:hypothetical protein